MRHPDAPTLLRLLLWGVLFCVSCEHVWALAWPFEPRLASRVPEAGTRHLEGLCRAAASVQDSPSELMT